MLLTVKIDYQTLVVRILKGSILTSIPFKTKNKNMQNDMRKGGTTRTDETRSLCLFNIGYHKNKTKKYISLFNIAIS